MKRANATGSIYKLSGKRRKHWAVKVTTGYSDDRKQVRKYLGYYETRKEALEALEHYLANPDAKDMTLQEAWEGWCEAFQGSDSTVAGYKTMFKKASKYHDRKLSDFNLDMMQEIVSMPPNTYGTAHISKNMLASLFDYGFAHDACPASRKELLKYIVTPEKKQAKRGEDKLFTPDQIQDAIDAHWVLAVVLLFTGMRRSELMSLKREDLDFESQFISIKKSKTSNGIRYVPIPDRLVTWVQEWLDLAPTMKSWEGIIGRYWNVYSTNGHTPHDCRHTYITMLVEAGVDDRLVKTLVGHAGGVTTDVYTHYSRERMLDTVNNVLNKYLPDIKDGREDYTETLSA